MTSHSDAADGPEDPPPGRAYTPSDRAVEWSIRASQRHARWLRRARPRPFGFAPGSAHATPEKIGEADGEGSLSSWVAAKLGLPIRATPVLRMSITYGDAGDPLAPAAEIKSAFDRKYQHIWSLEEELRDAAEKWQRAAAPDAVDWGSMGRLLRADARADRTVPVTRASIDVVVSGQPRRVSMLRLGECSGFEVTKEGVLVTVLARHMGPQFPDLVRLTDLEPMIAARYRFDREATTAALAKAPALGEKLRSELRKRGLDLSEEPDP